MEKELLEKDLNYLFNEIPLYKREKFDFFDEDENNFLTLNNEEFIRLCMYIGIANEKIISKCMECNYDFSFKVYSQWHNNFGKTQVRRFYIYEDGYLDFGSSNNYFGLDNYNGKLTSKNIYDYCSVMIDSHFNCTNDYNHVYNMKVMLEVKNMKFYVTKIGAFPSLQSIKGFDFDKYKKFLKKINAREDYKSVELCFADGYYVGSLLVNIICIFC